MKKEESEGNAIVALFTVLFIIIAAVCIGNGRNAIETVLISFWICVALMFIVSMIMKASKKNKQKQNEKAEDKDNRVTHSNSINTTTEEISVIPTYSDAIEEEMFVPTSKMEEIANQQPFGWEYLLFAQALKDDSSFLRKYRNQTPDNPFVKAIGNDSEGEKYTEYLRSMLAQTLLETSRLESKFSLYLSHLDEAMGEEGEDGDADDIIAVTIQFMEPYITYLAFYNDLCTIQCPPKAEEIHFAMKYLLEGLLNCFEDFYDNTYTHILDVVSHPEKADEGLLGHIKLNVDEAKTAFIQKALDKDVGYLSRETIHRKTC